MKMRKLMAVAAVAASAMASLPSFAAAAKSSITDVRVEPLLTTHWAQGSAGSAYCYNYYTPQHYACGCTATAVAQIMYYHRYPTERILPGETLYDSIDGYGSWRVETDGTGGVTRSSDSSFTAWDPAYGGPYDWSSMVNSPTSSTSENSRKAIGRLTRDAGLAMFAHYNLNSSGETSGYAMAKASGFILNLHYADAVRTGFNAKTLIANLDAGLPVQVGLANHDVVADGYGYDDGKLYIHINYGHGGTNDGWYDSTTDINGKGIQDMVANIFPPTRGSRHSSVISGRVLDASGNPVANATVTATGATNVTTTSSANGTYAFILPAGTYTFTATSGGNSGTITNCAVEASSQQTRAEGDSWSTGTNNSKNGINVTLGKTVSANEPDEYLEYVQSDGSQYIDTGVCPNANMTIDADVDLMGNGIFMGVSHYESYPIECKDGYIAGRLLSSAYATSSVVTNTGRHRIVASGTGTGKKFTISVDGSAVFNSTGNVSQGSAGATMYVFQGQYAGSTTCTAKLYGMKIYINNELVRDFVPGSKDGVAGLYDRQNDRWYSPNGTLTAGPVAAAMPSSPTPTEFTFTTRPHTVTLECATEGATIYYTTDGSDPTTSSTVYSAPFEVTRTTTVKAMAYKAGLNASSIFSVKFTYVSNEPDDYIEYVQSNGKQYFDLGFNGYSTMTLEADIDWVSGTYFAGVSHYETYPLKSVGGMIGGQLLNNANGSEAKSSVALNTGRHKVVSKGVHGQPLSITVDGVEAVATANCGARGVDDGSLKKSGQNMYLFAAQFNHNNQANNFSGKLYSLNISTNGVMARQFVPGIKNGVAGLYDRQNDRWYTSGTGTALIAGPVCTPTSPTPAEFTTSPQTVTLECATEGATIYYTTDGSDPTTSSTVYSAPFDVTRTTTVKARAYKAGLDASSIFSVTFAKVAERPDAYLEYVQSTGSQYINTGVCPNANMTIDADVDLMGNGIFMGVSHYESYPIECTGGHIAGRLLRSNYATTTVVTNTGRHRVVASATGTSKRFTISVDGSAVVNSTGNVSVSSAGATMYVFQGQYAGSTTCTAKLYGLKIYINGALERDFVPGIKNYVAGLYDRLNDVWYASQSGTELIPGPVKEPHNEPQVYLDYVKSTGAQWVETNFMPSRTMTVEADLDWVSGAVLAQNHYDIRVLSPKDGYIAGSTYSYSSYAKTGVPLDSGRHHVVVKSVNGQKLTVSVDGAAPAEAGSASSRDCTPPSLYIFAAHNGGGTGSYMDAATAKLYGLKMYDSNGILKRDFVPGIKDNVVGLYDRVSDKFYSSGTSTPLVAGPAVERCKPDAFVEYVESNGSQWVDTGVDGRAGVKAEADIDWVNGTSPLGVIGNSHCLLLQDLGGIGGQARGSGEVKTGVAVNSGRHLIVSEVGNGSKMTITVDGTTSATSAGNASGSTGVTIWMFAARDYGGTKWGQGRSKFYGLKLWQTGSDGVCRLQRHFIPCKRNNRAGLYDAVSGVIFYSITSTDLTAGPEVARAVWRDTAQDASLDNAANWAGTPSASADAVVCAPWTPSVVSTTGIACAGLDVSGGDLSFAVDGTNSVAGALKSSDGELTFGHLILNGTGCVMRVTGSMSVTGTATLGGNLTLADGATLAFNFTDRNTTSVLDAAGKTVTAEGTVNVKISTTGGLRPRSGRYTLTSGGAFAGKTVALDGASKPKWAKCVSVVDGDIVLEVIRAGVMVIAY